MITSPIDDYVSGLSSILLDSGHSYMRTIITGLLCFLLAPVCASAQSAVTAGRAQSVDVSLGYSYINHPVSPSNRIGLNGLDANATIGLFSPRLAIRADLAYAQTAHALGTPSNSSVLSYMAGPVFRPTIQGKFDTYVHALFGGARVSGPVPVNGGILIGGYASGFAWLVGGGVEYQVSKSIALRSGLDYLRAGYFNPSLTVQGQNNLRATVAVVYLFGTQRRRRR